MYMSICLFIEANWIKYVLCAFVHIHVTIIKEEMNLEGVGGRKRRESWSTHVWNFQNT